jgi:hypothetical protein
MTKRTSLLLLLIIFCLPVFSQTRGFSKKPEVFIQELGEWMKSTKEEPAVQAYQHFSDLWNAAKFNEVQQNYIIRSSEEMVVRGNKVNPDFTLYLKTLSVTKDSGVAEPKIDNWLKASLNFIQSSSKNFVPFMQSTYWLFSESSIYISDSKKWQTSPTDYTFNFNSTKGVNVTFKNIDLFCKTAADFIWIRNTGGVWEIDAQKFSGSKGQIDWDRVGIPANDAFVELGDYKIDLTKAEFKADSVWLKYDKLIGEKLLGSLEDKASYAAASDDKEKLRDIGYPHFISKRKDVTLAKFSSGKVLLKGGMELKGGAVISGGTPENKATVEIYYKKKLMVLARSENFTIKESQLKSLKTEITIYTDSGNIYHPMMQFNFNIGKELLVLTRGKEGIEQAPLYDTDHNLEIWVDQVIWKLDEPRINLDMLMNEDIARFESANFYREFNYEKIMGMLSYHPLTKMSKYCTDNRKWEFTLGEYASSIGSKKENLKQQIIMLNDEGFIYFDPVTEKIRVKEKLINYVRNHYKIADYDVIRFSSVIGARPNAYLNLINYDLVLEGVRAFRFSDSQQVAAIPSEQKVTIKNNRRLIFGGRVTAGRFDFFGAEFDFEYERFSITSQLIDSMKIFYPDTLEGNFLIPVKTVLRDLNGELLIDKPNNKSGFKDYPDYPIFSSRGRSVIAYDKQGIFNGAYKKDIFRFEVDPFQIDSLDNFTISGLKFPGMFVSGGILPEFKYEASIMKDYSLGFERANPPGGYEMYEGKGHGEIDISLSEQGFWAKGEIEYEGAKMVSDKIVMMPDSMNAEVKEYSIARNAKYPRLLATDVLTHWMPKSDSMYINTKGHDVDIFADGQTFKGNLVQTSKQLSGSGVLSWDNARLTSADMRFSPNRAKAEISRIEIGDFETNKISLASPNVKSDVDFDNRTGDFIANQKGLFTELPFNQFATSMDHFFWDMNRKTVLFTKTGSLKDEESIFISRNPLQAGLSFMCPRALFNMTEGVLYAEKVPYIDVADSRVFPDEGKVVINKDADIQELKKAKLLAARDNKFHDVYDANVKVAGKYALSGNGYYKFKDKHQTGQVIYFNVLKVDRDTHVLASGYLYDSLNFVISPKIGYKGSVELFSHEEFLSFNGYVKPLHTFTGVWSNWFRYTGKPDPTDLVIPASDPKNEDRRSMNASLNLASDSVHMYPSFFNFKRVYADPEITNDTGVFYYDEAEQEFRVGNSEKLLNNAPRGSYLAFNEKTRTIYSEGKLNLGLNFHEKFNIITAGKAYKQEEDSTFTIETLFGMEVVLPDECYTRMLEVIKKSGGSSSGIDLKEDYLKNALAEFLEDKKLDKVMEEINDNSQMRFFDEIGQSLFFTKANLEVSRSKQGLIGNGPIELAAIKGQAVNKAFDSKILITRKRSGARLTLYFEVSKYDYFYFDYFRGVLTVYSTDKEFNDAIVQKSKKINQKGYVLRMASPRTVTKFIDDMDR